MSQKPLTRINRTTKVRIPEGEVRMGRIEVEKPGALSVTVFCYFDVSPRLFFLPCDSVSEGSSHPGRRKWVVVAWE